jgi:hypothetical protein
MGKQYFTRTLNVEREKKLSNAPRFLLDVSDFS